MTKWKDHPSEIFRWGASLWATKGRSILSPAKKSRKRPWKQECQRDWHSVAADMTWFSLLIILCHLCAYMLLIHVYEPDSSIWPVTVWIKVSLFHRMAFIPLIEFFWFLFDFLEASQSRKEEKGVGIEVTVFDGALVEWQRYVQRLGFDVDVTGSQQLHALGLQHQSLWRYGSE